MDINNTCKLAYYHVLKIHLMKMAYVRVVIVNVMNVLEAQIKNAQNVILVITY